MESNIRDTVIKINGIKNADYKYYFYYDETNNLAKLRLKDGVLNVQEPVCFVLGGMVSKHEICLPSLDYFRNLLGLQDLSLIHI